MPITIEDFLEELFKTVGITCTKVTFKAISGSVQDTRSITINSIGLMVRCLATFEWFSIELDNPIITQDEKSPFRITSVTILLRKINSHLQIERIYTDEEEIFEDTNWAERAKKWLSRWKPAIDLILILVRIFGSLLALSGN